MKAASLENKPAAGPDEPLYTAPARRASGQGGVLHALEPFKGFSARNAFVFIRRHACFSFLTSFVLPRGFFIANEDTVTMIDLMPQNPREEPLVVRVYSGY